MSYNAKVRKEQDPDRQVVANGGYLDIESGGEVDFESGSALKLAGTQVTATASELNILDGVTSTAAELNILDGVTADKDEINFLDGATAGTQVASKAVIADANINTGVSKVTELHIGVSGSETQVTATAAELNKNDVSAQAETITEAGAISVLVKNTKLDSTGGTFAATLAAPNAAMYGQVKTIEMTVDNGDVTLALTNVQGGSAATTATFADVNDCLILVAGTSKWHVIGESGVALT